MNKYVIGNDIRKTHFEKKASDVGGNATLDNGGQLALADSFQAVMQKLEGKVTDRLPSGAKNVVETV